MITQGYTGSAAAKASLAVLSKVSATTFALTLGTAVMAVVAGALLVAQVTGVRSWQLEDLDRENLKAS